MTSIYLIRHGEAEGNIYRRAQGHHQGKITAKGKRQIDALSERFRHEQIDALYSSDLLRTQETAGAITRYHNLEMRLEPRLREVNMGCWEDVPWGNLQHEHPEAMIAFNDDPDRWRAEGAETFPELKTRMLGVIREIASRHDGQTVVCVSHGMAIRSLISEIMGVPSNEIYKVPHGDNTAVSLLEVDNGKIRIEYYNDTSHLPDDLSTFARQSWWKKPGLHDFDNVRFERLDPNKQPELYSSFYGKTWKAVHGSMKGYEPKIYLDSAKIHFEQDPDSIVVIKKGNEVVGITELDTQRGKKDGIGWICLCYIKETERRRLLGVQLIGHAISVFTRLGMRAIRLHVFAENQGAIRFYSEYGFKIIGESDGVIGTLYTMEKEI